MKLSTIQNALIALKQHYSSLDTKQQDECKEIDALLSGFNDPNDDVPWRICLEILKLQPKVEIGSFIIGLKAFILKSSKTT